MYDSLRQIRNSASKKQLNKIFERKEQEDDDCVDSPNNKTAYDGEWVREGISWLLNFTC